MGAQTTDPRPIPRLSVAGLRAQNTGGPVHSSLARLIASGLADSRADLVKSTGLARSTVTRHLDTMIDAGVVTEGGAVTRPGRGRPPLCQPPPAAPLPPAPPPAPPGWPRGGPRGGEPPPGPPAAARRSGWRST